MCPRRLLMLEHNTITLNDSDKEAINAVLDGGEFTTPEEVIHVGISLLKQRQEKIEALRDAIQEGRYSDYIDDFNWDVFLEEKHKEHQDR